MLSAFRISRNIIIKSNRNPMKSIGGIICVKNFSSTPDDDYFNDFLSNSDSGSSRFGSRNDSRGGYGNNSNSRRGYGNNSNSRGGYRNNSRGGYENNSRWERGSGSSFGGNRDRYGNNDDGWVSGWDNSQAKQDFSKLPKINKDISSKMPPNQASEADRQAFIKENNIELVGADNIFPILNFEDAGFSTDITKNWKKAAFQKPSPIQSQCWPLLLKGKDSICVAETGSGKTLGFILPAAMHIQNQEPTERGDGPRIMIICPTRELAQQIHESSIPFIKPVHNMVSLYGGASKGPQINALSGYVDFVVGTPGRINDLISDGNLMTDKVTMVVLDEADRMLDMGFEPQIRSIFENIRPDRQTVMFSATWPLEVRRLANEFSEDAVRITVGGDTLKANPKIKQVVKCVLPMRKNATALQILEEHKKDKILLFVKTKASADTIARTIDRSGYRSESIHGDKSQSYRERALRDFRNGRVQVLVATDVASRGIDVKGIDCVINYDAPSAIADYIHRIGRTGRAGASGVAYTLLTQEDGSIIGKDLIKVLQDANQEVPRELSSMRLSSKKPAYGARGNFGSGARFGGRDDRYGSRSRSGGFGGYQSDNRNGGRGGRGYEHGNQYKSRNTYSELNSSRDSDLDDFFSLK